MYQPFDLGGRGVVVTGGNGGIGYGLGHGSNSSESGAVASVEVWDMGVKATDRPVGPRHEIGGSAPVEHPHRLETSLDVVLHRPGGQVVPLEADTPLVLGRVSNLPTVWSNTLAGVALGQAD